MRMILPRCIAGQKYSNWLSALAAMMILPGGFPIPANAQPESIDLAGNWSFQADPTDVGKTEKWFDKALPGTIRLPGSMASNGLGDEVSTTTPWMGEVHKKAWFDEPGLRKFAQPGNFKFPYWLTPVKYYAGAAWYQRTITIPEKWNGSQVEMLLERAHWGTEAWIDSSPVGTQESLSTPHNYNLGKLTPGTHRLTVRVDNRLLYGVGVNAHSVSDHTQTNWNGIAGRMELKLLHQLSIRNLQVYPDAAGKKVRVVASIENTRNASASGTLRLEIQSAAGATELVSETVTQSFQLNGTTGTVEAELKLTQRIQVWDEFSPALYRVEASVSAEPAGSVRGGNTASFGFRDFKSSGTQFCLNDRPVYLRGTLECCIFPLTGYPPADKESWARIIRIARSHGLNHLRFHSWCPPKAAFEAADEAGFIYSIEVASWAVVGEDSKYTKWLYEEADAILNAYGNHPSFCMMLYGNEPHGKKQKEFLAEFVNHYKARDTRRLYSSGAGWPLIPENEFHVTPTPRIHHWGHGLKSRINAKAPETTTDYSDFINKHKVPVISHEIGQWCVYPNLDERSKYTGVTRAYNFDIFEDSLRQNHMLDQARDFLIASGKLQALCYKEEIESALRTPGMGGFQLLDLHDFPGQGTALVGVLDPFWDEKGYITAAEYKRFSGPTVPLAQLHKRVFTNAEELTASVLITHYGAVPLRDATPQWSLRGTNGSIVASGTLPSRDIPLGTAIPLGDIRAPLSGQVDASKLVLTVALEGTEISNTWDVWVYPSKQTTPPPTKTLITTTLDDKALSALQKGGKVILLPSAEDITTDSLGIIPAGFSSIFWNTAWTNRQPPHTLGILCKPQHPAFSVFPTEFHSNWQWWYLITRSKIMLLDKLPPDVRPIVQIIDDWVTNRRLGLVFEAKVQGGSLLVCSVDLNGDITANPVALQLKSSLIKYVESDAFAPKVTVSLDELGEVIKLHP